MAEIEIGLGKSGRRAYGFDDIAIVPSRRTRDPEDVDISWQLDAYKFELPLLAAAMDGVVSPATAIEIGRLGGCGVLNLEGLWTRYEDADSILEDIANSPVEKATRRMQQVYGEPMKAELVTQRIREIKAAGVIAAAAITPQRAEQFMPAIIAGEIDILVIQGTVVSAEHVSKTRDPLNLKTMGTRARHPRDRRRVRQLPGGACISCAPVRPASSSVSARAMRARRAACSASACRRQRRSPMPRRPACAISTKPASTST